MCNSQKQSPPHVPNNQVHPGPGFVLAPSGGICVPPLGFLAGRTDSGSYSKNVWLVRAHLLSPVWGGETCSVLRTQGPALSSLLCHFLKGNHLHPISHYSWMCLTSGRERARFADFIQQLQLVPYSFTCSHASFLKFAFCADLPVSIDRALDRGWQTAA